MIFFKKVTGCMVLLMLFASAYASAATDLGSLLGGIHSMQADFKQTIYDNHGKAIQTSTGRMAMQRPGKFRWQVTKPIPQLIIANEQKLWVYDPDLLQLTIRPIKQAAGEAPALLLSHVGTVIEKDYAVTQLPSQSGLIRFKLVPRQADNMFASIEMDFNKDKLEKMNLVDHLGHTTKITFLKPAINATLASSLFNFKPPANVDIVDETKQRN